MSIAIVRGVYFGENGEHRIELTDYCDDSRGQSTLLFGDPHPADVDLLTTEQVWGSANSLMHGEALIATRDSYTRITFVVPSIGAVIDKERERRTGVQT